MNVLFPLVNKRADVGQEQGRMEPNRKVKLKIQGQGRAESGRCKQAAGARCTRGWGSSTNSVAKYR